MTISLKHHLVAAAALAVVVAPLAGTPAEADGTPASVSVTIAGNDSPFGEVKSARRFCKANVTVRVFKQVGARGGSDDQPVGSPDTTSLQGTKWTWSIGNPGLNDGDKVYAKVKGNSRCKRAFSPTITVDNS